MCSHELVILITSTAELSTTWVCLLGGKVQKCLSKMLYLAYVTTQTLSTKESVGITMLALSTFFQYFLGCHTELNNYLCLFVKL